MPFDWKDWEMLGRRGGWQCGLCLKWWPGSNRIGAVRHCKSFKPQPSIRPILRRKSDGKIVIPLQSHSPDV